MSDGRSYTTEESEFLKAIDTYKRVNQRPFPTWSEILSIAKSLGYRKIAECVELPTYSRGVNQYSKDKDSNSTKCSIKIKSQDSKYNTDNEVSDDDTEPPEQGTLRIHCD